MKSSCPVSAITNIYEISTGSLYYEPVPPKDESYIEELVRTSFEKSGGTYGKRRIKIDIAITTNNEIILSVAKIGKIMKKLGLVSSYIKGRVNRPSGAGKPNESHQINIVAQEFNNREQYEVLLSDVLYARIAGVWYFLCPLLELNRREIIGFSVGSKHNSELVCQAFYSASIDLRKFSIFHTDRGSEFSSQSITNLLSGFGIVHSLSKKGCPYDNAPMEAFFKTLRSEYLNINKFNSLAEFRAGLSEWIYWYNHVRLHSSLGYQSPIQKEAK